MKYRVLILMLTIFPTIFAQVVKQAVNDSSAMQNAFQQEFQSWDAQKGSLAFNQISALIDDRGKEVAPMNVSQTAFELLQEMPDEQVERLEQMAATNAQNSTNTIYWNRWNSYLQASRCGVKKARSYGDPHMLTFNGARYDFQLGGMYLLAASPSGNFVVQSQMRRSNQDVSLNVAVAVDVNGDHIEFYVNRNFVNGLPQLSYVNNQLMGQQNRIMNQTGFFSLPNGGIIERQTDKYVVKAPSGEQIAIKQGRWSGEDYLNIVVYVPACQGPYRGLLGIDGDMQSRFNHRQVIAYHGQPTRVQRPTRTPNGGTTTTSRRQPGDDGNVRSPITSRQPTYFGDDNKNIDELKRRASINEQIANTYGTKFKVQNDKSLFSKEVSKSKFDGMPINYNKVSTMDEAVVKRGLEKARAAGVPEEDLYAAVYDYGVMNVEPKAEHYNFYSPKDKNTVSSTASQKVYPVLRKSNSQAGKTMKNVPVSKKIEKQSTVQSTNTTIGKDVKRNTTIAPVRKKAVKADPFETNTLPKTSQRTIEKQPNTQTDKKPSSSRKTYSVPNASQSTRNAQPSMPDNTRTVPVNKTESAPTQRKVTRQQSPKPTTSSRKATRPSPTRTTVTRSTTENQAERPAATQSRPTSSQRSSVQIRR